MYFLIMYVGHVFISPGTKKTWILNAMIDILGLDS